MSSYILDADKEIQKFYDRMWGKQTKEATPTTITPAKKYAMVLNDINIGWTVDGRLVRDPVGYRMVEIEE